MEKTSSTEQFIYNLVYINQDSHIISLYDSDPGYPHGHHIPEGIAHNQAYLLITNKETTETEIVMLYNIDETMSRKTGLKMVVNHGKRQTIPEEMNLISDNMQFDRWYTYFNLNGLMAKVKNNEKTIEEGN